MIHCSYPLSDWMISKNAWIKRHTEARFEDLMKGEFFNLPLKKDLLLCREFLIRERLAFLHLMS
jgi:hypothetical protein